ncbi:MAG: hypothetical protein JAZ06_16325 [Candidatus Thiodiazotropha taylori]|nr:hypothetical protein [Candidatus Thiodiazotropha taylori]
MNKRIFTLILALLIPTVSFAEGENATSIVTRGLEAYSKGGPSAAVKSWIKGSGLEGSKEALSQANVLRQVEDFYGSYEGYEILNNHKISNRTNMVLFVINFTKGPMFGRFQSYRTESGEWVATEFKFHTEATLVFPSKFVFGE